MISTAAGLDAMSPEAMGIKETIGDYNNDNNNSKDNVYGDVIMAQPLREFTRFTRMNTEQRQGTPGLWTKPMGLSHRSAYRQL